MFTPIYCRETWIMALDKPEQAESTKPSYRKPSHIPKIYIDISNSSDETTKRKDRVISPAQQFLAKFRNISQGECTSNPSSIRNFNYDNNRLDDESEYRVKNHILGRLIGRGAFSSVREAFSLDHRQVLACKVVHKSDKATIIHRNIHTQFQLWKELSHEHLLPLEFLEENSLAYFAFSPLASCSLYDLLKKDKDLVFERALLYSNQLVQALYYLHCEKHIIHHDVKLENCLLFGEYNNSLKLGDFGFAQYVDTIYDENEEDLCGGSLPYIAPEQLDSVKPVNTPSVDMWSLGVLMYALYTGCIPFGHSIASVTEALIKQGDYDKALLHKCCSDKTCLTIVEGLLLVNSSSRINMEQMMNLLEQKL